MIRLYDRVMTQGYWIKDDSPTKALDWLVAMDADPPAVLIDNVADYYFAERRRRDRLWVMEDFPNLAPPWPIFWVEWRPKAEHMPASPTPGKRLPMGIGVAFHTVDLGEEIELLAADDADELGEVEGVTLGRRRGLRPPGAPMARWQVRCAILQPDTADEKVWAMATFRMHLDRHGAFVRPPLLAYDSQTGERRPGRTVIETQLLEGGSPDERRERAFVLAHNVLYPALLAITFAHCRNVELVDVPAAPPRFARAYQRRRGRPLGRYQTLLIEPATRLLRETGKSETEGVPRALHICRGHFATYGKDGRGLLFGKRAGTFWIPTHERGQADAGVVVSDYEVRPAVADD